MSFFISRLYIRGLSSVKKDDIPFFSTQKPTQSTTEPFIFRINRSGWLRWKGQEWIALTVGVSCTIWQKENPPQRRGKSFEDEESPKDLFIQLFLIFCKGRSSERREL